MPVPLCENCESEVADPSNYQESWNNVGVQGEEGVYCSHKCKRVVESDENCDRCGGKLEKESVSYEDSNYCSIDCMKKNEDDFDISQYLIVYKCANWTVDRGGASKSIVERKGRFEGDDVEEALTGLMKEENANQDIGGVVEICSIENIVEAGDEN